MDFGFDPFETSAGDDNNDQIIDKTQEQTTEEEYLNVENTPQKDAVLWVVDCSRFDVFKTNQQSPGYFSAVMDTLQGFLKNKIITSEDRDLLGLVFLGVEDLDPPVKVKSESGEAVALNTITGIDKSIMSVILPLTPPSASSIHVIKALGWGEERYFTIKFFNLS
jgi:hypothetical protein